MRNSRRYLVLGVTVVTFILLIIAILGMSKVGEARWFRGGSSIAYEVTNACSDGIHFKFAVEPDIQGWEPVTFTLKAFARDSYPPSPPYYEYEVGEHTFQLTEDPQTLVGFSPSNQPDGSATFSFNNFTNTAYSWDADPDFYSYLDPGTRVRLEITAPPRIDTYHTDPIWITIDDCSLPSQPYQGERHVYERRPAPFFAPDPGAPNCSVGEIAYHTELNVERALRFFDLNLAMFVERDGGLGLEGFAGELTSPEGTTITVWDGVQGNALGSQCATQQFGSPTADFILDAASWIYLDEGEEPYTAAAYEYDPPGSSNNWFYSGMARGTWTLNVCDTYVPTLEDIANADGDGAFTVNWDWPDRPWPTDYRLQEQHNGGAWSEVYFGEDTSYGPLARNDGEWCYRIRGEPKYYSDQRSWSTPKCTTVGFRNGSFEQGAVGWTEYSSNGYPLTFDDSVLPVTPRDGHWAAWLGGVDGEVSYIEQTVRVTPLSSLIFWYWVQSEDTCGHDFGSVRANGTVVDTFDLCDETGAWQMRAVGLHSYAGEDVTVQFRAETDASLTSNLFIDKVSLGILVTPFSSGYRPQPVNPRREKDVEATKAPSLLRPRPSQEQQAAAGVNPPLSLDCWYLDMRGRTLEQVFVPAIARE